MHIKRVRRVAVSVFGCWRFRRTVRSSIRTQPTCYCIIQLCRLHSMPVVACVLQLCATCHITLSETDIVFGFAAIHFALAVVQTWCENVLGKTHSS